MFYKGHFIQILDFFFEKKEEENFQMFHPKVNFFESSKVCAESLLHFVGINPDILTYNSDTAFEFRPFEKPYFNYGFDLSFT